jgi:hypothetical protein
LIDRSYSSCVPIQEPGEDVLLADRQGAIGVGDSDRPEFTHRFELKRWMSRVLFKDRVLFGGAPPDFFRQPVVVSPKFRKRP